MSRTRLVVVGGDAAGRWSAHQSLRTASRSGLHLDGGLGTAITASMSAQSPSTLPARAAERGTRRLLGGQIVGGTGAGRRIDTIASVVHDELAIDEFAAPDLAYATPSATVWEAAQRAARRLADRME